MSALRLPAGLALLLAALPAAAAVPGLRVTRTVEAAGCGDAVADGTHAFARLGEPGAGDWVDLEARSWALGFPVLYERDGEGPLLARERHRLGEGAVVVEARLRPAEGRFAVRLRPEPAGDFAAAREQYLPGVPLPCASSGALRVEEAGAGPADPEAAVRVYRLLHRATEALYDEGFEAAETALAEARRLRPRSATVAWMRARARFLEGEARPAEDVEGRLEAFRAAERHADRAVALEPELAEGHLWRAVARGRILTTQGRLATALDAVGRDRGPRWVAESFERAIALPSEYRHFGDSTRADALHGAAQLYRMLPDGAFAEWAFGVRGDLDRAVSLSRRALRHQPDRIEYAKELAVELLCRGARRERAGDLAEARRLLERVGRLPARTVYDRIDRAHAERLLRAAPERACGYSRDRWAEEPRPVVAKGEAP